MRRILGGILLVGFLLAGKFLVHSSQAKVAYNPQNLVRLHVIANSDQEEDQALKNEVRDVILEKLQPEFQKTNSLNEVRSLILNDLKSIQVIAEAYLREVGSEDPVRVEYGTFPFPVKGYGSLVLPAGDYEAVRVIIGNGQGSNWWCVLFPPLCFVDISKGVPDEESIQEVLKNSRLDGEIPLSQPKLKFKTLELIQSKKAKIRFRSSGADFLMGSSPG